MKHIAVHDSEHSVLSPKSLVFLLLYRYRKNKSAASGRASPGGKDVPAGGMEWRVLASVNWMNSGSRRNRLLNRCEFGCLCVEAVLTGDSRHLAADSVLDSEFEWAGQREGSVKVCDFWPSRGAQGSDVVVV